MVTVDELKQRGMAAFQASQFESAASLFDQARKLAPKDPDVWNMLAVTSSILGDIEAAEKGFRKVIRLQPKAHTVHNNLGTVLKDRGKLKEAERCYRKALDLMPSYAEAANNLATLLRMNGDGEQALVFYQQALALKPDYAEAYSNFGALLQEVGRVGDALQSYRRAVELQPTHPEWVFNYGCGLLEAGSFDDAQAVFHQLIQLAPQDARAWDGLCNAQLHQKQFESAITNGHKAIEFDPTNADAWFHLGVAYQSIKNSDKAIELYQKVLELDAGHDSAQYFLAILGAVEVPDKSPTDYVKDLFDGYAETFDNALVNNLEYRTPTLLFEWVERYIGETEKNLDIMDLGCGTGLIGPLFRNIAARLLGVDLSPKMVEKARERNVYDELFVDDLVPPLQDNKGALDLVLAADVFVYLGDLDDVFAATVESLRAEGLFLFSTEKSESSDRYELRESGRYAHAVPYVESLAKSHGFSVLSNDDVVLRKDGGRDINGSIYALRLN